MSPTSTTARQAPAGGILVAPVVPTDVAGDALRLHLGPTAWPPVATHTVVVAGLAVVTMEVLAASHRVTVAALDQPHTDAFVETVACGTAHSRPVEADHLPARHETPVAAGHYRFRSTTSPGAEAVTRAAHHVRTLTDGLTVAFPGHPDALTGLRVMPSSEGAGTVQWSTWHVYPHAHTPHVVTTSSHLLVNGWSR